MANLLVTGASGGIGKHLCRHLAASHVVMPVSRRPADGSAIAPCDLVTDVPHWRDANGADACEVDWVIHLATTYRVAGDLSMLDNLLEFAREKGIENVLYVSSWVVHFPRRPLKASYIKLKRRCEQRLLESGVANPHILRPSVVTGEGLSWTRTLRRLAPFSPLVPPRFSRSFVSVDEVCRSVDRVIAGETHSTVVTALGQRLPLAEKAREHRTTGQARWSWLIFFGMVILLTVAGVLLFQQATTFALVAVAVGLLSVVALRCALPRLLGSLSDYFAGFFERRFEPQSERDVIALCHRDNDNIQVRGYDNARLYFQRPHHPRRTTISLRRFNQVLDLDCEQKLVHVQAGANFGQLLPLLESHGMWMENYPNYHFITVGACLATAVHGSNLDKPFLADLVESIRVYDRDQDEVVELHRHDPRFGKLVFHQDCPQKHIVLSAKLRICQRQYYELTTERRPVASLTFAHVACFSEDAQHYEVRINTPKSREAVLQSYRQISSEDVLDADARSDRKLLAIKADAIGRKWNLLQKNAVCSLLTSAVARCFINYEWFFAPDDFPRFWKEVVGDRKRYRLYKLLVRHNPRQPDVNTRYHGTVSIDVTIFNTRSMLEVSAELFERYRPFEHLGKYSIQRYINQRNDRRTVAEHPTHAERRPEEIVVD